MTPEVKLRRQRRATVTRRYQGGALAPQIRLTGWWLEAAGFPPGSLLAVAVEHGRLVVTVAAKPWPSLPSLRQAFHRLTVL